MAWWSAGFAREGAGEVRPDDLFDEGLVRAEALQHREGEGEERDDGQDAVVGEGRGADREPVVEEPPDRRVAEPAGAEERRLRLRAARPAGRPRSAPRRTRAGDRWGCVAAVVTSSRSFAPAPRAAASGAPPCGRPGAGRLPGAAVRTPFFPPPNGAPLRAARVEDRPREARKTMATSSTSSRRRTSARRRAAPLELAVSIAREGGAELSVVHVCEIPSYTDFASPVDSRHADHRRGGDEARRARRIAPRRVPRGEGHGQGRRAVGADPRGRRRARRGLSSSWAPTGAAGSRTRSWAASPSASCGSRQSRC